MNPLHKKWYEDAKVHAGTQAGLLAPNDSELAHRRMASALKLINVCIARLMGSGKETITLLDVGCGYADLGALVAEGTLYTGLEEIQWIYEAAKEKHPNLNVINVSLSEYVWAFKKEDRPSYDIVVALGVMATLTEIEDGPFVEDLTCLADKYLVLSYQDATRYKGQFRSFTNEQVMEMFCCPIMQDDAIIPEWDTQNWVLMRLL